MYSCIVRHFTLVDVEAGLDFGLHTCLRLNLVWWYHSDCTAVTAVWVANCERSNIWTKFIVVFVCGIHCSFYLYCCFRASWSKSVCICSRLTSVSLKVSTLLFVADFSLCTKVYCRKSCVLDLVRNPFVNLSSRFFLLFSNVDQHMHVLLTFSDCFATPSVLWCSWLGSRKGIWPVKNWSLEWGADLYMTQLMPLPPTIFCFSKIQIGFAFCGTGLPGVVAEKGAVKRLCCQS